MKQHHPLTKQLAKVLFALVRLLLSLRYRVKVKGQHVLKTDGSKLILPNHQAIIDPILLFAQLYRYTTAVPVITASYYDLPVAKLLFGAWGAVRVSDLEAGSRNTNVLTQIITSLRKGLMMNKNIVLYPSGQIAAQGYERIINKQSAQLGVLEAPDKTEIIAVRISGLWGSRWSRAWMGQSPSFFPTLIKCVGILLSNLLLFTPRRKIQLEFINISRRAREESMKGRAAFNRYLEQVYNQYGEESVSYVRYHFMAPPLNRNIPTSIAGSLTEQHKQHTSGLQTIPPEVFNQVRNCITQVLDIDTANIKTDHFLQLDLGADSLNIVEIISEIENRFPNFSAPEINAIRTVHDLCLVAMGQFKRDEDLKPSYLDRPLSSIGRLEVTTEGTILEQMIATFSRNGADPFCYDAMLGTTTRKQFFLKACVVAQYIKGRCHEPNIGIMLPALQSTTLLIAACYLAGKVPVMLNWTVGPKVLLHCVETAGVSTILSAGPFVEKIDEQLPPAIKAKILFLEREIPKIKLGTKLRGVLTARFPHLFIKKNDQQSTAVILFTSGSEAMPKAVPLSHHNIISNLSAAFQMLTVSNNLTFLSFLPPFHSFGFTVLNIMPLITGAKVGYTPNPTDAREVLRILKHIKANVLVGTPGFLKLLLADTATATYAFKTVQFAISGAEAMPNSMKEQFETVTNGGLILEGYGITECSPVLTLNPENRQKSGSVGKFLPGIAARILDIERHTEVPIGTAGMIYVKGPNVFNGYLKAPELQPFERIEGEKWYKTGDLGYLDEDGYLFITGRLKRFIKIAGEMISLPFIEQILLEKYGSEETTVLAVEGNDECQPPRIALFCTIPLNLEEVNAYLLQKGVAPIAKLREKISLDFIPLLGTGKTDYKILRNMLR